MPFSKFMLATLALSAGFATFSSASIQAQTHRPATLSPEFEPVFDGSSLNGWTSKGGSWRSQQGSILGSGPGYIRLDHAYQDGRLQFRFKCSSCDIGLLLRGADVPAGTTGLYISLNSSDLGTPYIVTLDSSGKEIDRHDITRLPPPPRPASANRATASIRPAAQQPPPPKPSLNANDWNFVELALRGDALTGTINGVSIGGGERTGGIAQLNSFGFAAFELKAGNAGFSDIALEDFETRRMPSGAVGTGFEMRRVTDQFYAETAAIGDLNHDGKEDIVSGPFWYEGPDFKIAHEIAATTTLATSSGYPAWGDTTIADYNGDGWPDIMSQTIANGFAINLYLNPKGESRHWEKVVIAPATVSELMPVCDLFKDGKKLPIAIVGGSLLFGGKLGYFTPDASDIRKPWTFHAVSEASLPPRALRPGPSQHGMGCGDINGDGRIDLINGNGWWEQPEHLTDAIWTFHSAPFDALRDDDRRDGGGGSRMFAYDLNGDGRADVVTSLAAHGWGLAWFEQNKDATWTRHLIMGEPMSPGETVLPPISELHAIEFVDLDGDGLKDIVAGKRWWSHGDLYTEIGFQSPPTLYWFQQKKDHGKIEFIPHLIHDDSGVGTSIAVGDVNADGKPDIVTAARHGVFVFLNTMTPSAKLKPTK